MLKNYKNKTNVLFFVFNGLISFWAFGCYIQSTTTSIQVGLNWDQYIYSVAIFVPIILLAMINSFAKIERNRLTVVALVSSCILLVMNWTRYFRSGMYFGARFLTIPSYGWYAYLGMYAGIFLCALYDLWLKHNFSVGTEKKKYHYLLISMSILFSAGNAYFLLIIKKFNPIIDSLLNLSSSLFVSIYIVLMAWIILKYELIDIAGLVTKSVVRQYESQHQEKQIAEAANQFKTRFLAQLCHDFRTPLHTILGFSQYIQDHPDENPQKSPKFIYDSADLLLRSVADMIDIERIEKGDIPMQEEIIHLPNFLSDIDAVVHSLIQEKPIIFTLKTVPDLPDIESDPALLKRILINLLSNAIKFTDEGYVTLTVSFESDRLMFAVHDTGIGFDEQKIPHLFEAYTQENPTGDASGVGLGLSIVHAFVTRLSGHIKVKSTLKKGSEFSVQIPVKKSHALPDNQPLIKKEKDISQKRILVCDDTGINRIYTKMLLQKRVIYTDVDSGEAALEITKIQDFDIIFLDVHMPDGINGLDTCKFIRKHYQEKAQSPPIICAITAQPNLHNQETIAALGFDTFLRKPFTEQELLGFLAT
ncbi:MAG: response regulator [Candidatus Margulisbacteria bacterium]|nr:response regulator [Candidatus Margulisiibacteriota bacterium]